MGLGTDKLPLSYVLLKCVSTNMRCCTCLKDYNVHWWVTGFVILVIYIVSQRPEPGAVSTTATTVLPTTWTSQRWDETAVGFNKSINANKTIHVTPNGGWTSKKCEHGYRTVDDAFEMCGEAIHVGGDPKIDRPKSYTVKEGDETPYCLKFTPQGKGKW